MNLNIKNMLTGEPQRLAHTPRFSGDRLLFPQSVAEHTFQVCLYALLISDWCNWHGVPVDVGRLLRRAVVHDLEEAWTGDLRRPFKHHFADVKRAVDAAGPACLEQVLGEVTVPMTDRLVKDWKDAKDNTIEGQVIELADFLSALATIHQEFEAGNRKIVHDTRLCPTHHFRRFADHRFKSLRPLVEQTAELLMEIYGDFTQRTGGGGATAAG